MDIKKNKVTKNTFTTFETVVFVFASLIIGLTMGFILNKNSSKVTKEITDDTYLSEFIRNYNFILNNYYEDIDKEKLINNAISGMMESLDDPYSMYFDETETNNFSTILNGSYEGLGIQIAKEAETGYMIITSVFKNSPASKSGLEVGDKIVSINDKKVSEVETSEFSKLVKESKDKSFIITLLRDGESITKTVDKNVVTLNSVVSKTFKLENKKVGYIYIGVFANNTYDQFESELEKLEKEKIDFLVIDVRGNTGGHLTAVEKILDLFLNDSQIMYQFEKNNEITATYATGKDKKDYEIVLLGDSTSASASEVLISSLKENLDSKFFGKKTYGKGTVQELVTLSDGTQYKITVKKWLTPSSNWVNDTEGIEPDYEVDLDDKYYETYADEDDSQLQYVLEYLKNR